MSIAVQEMSIADKLRAQIESCGMSHGELAKAAGVPQPSISRFMRGDRGLSLETAEALADFFGLELTPKPAPKPRKK